MILTTGDNYVKLNESTDFITFMNAIWQQAGAGNQEFSYLSGADYGHGNSLGYPVGQYHFQYLPKNTKFINMSSGVANMKLSTYTEPFMLVGSHTRTLTGDETGFSGGAELNPINEGFFKVGETYNIKIPSWSGGAGYNDIFRSMYNEDLRSDVLNANGYYPLPNGDVRTSIQTMNNSEKYRCAMPFLVPAIQFDKSVLHKIFPDVISKDYIQGSPNEGKINHETYFCVYGGPPKPINDADELLKFSTAITDNGENFNNGNQHNNSYAYQKGTATTGDQEQGTVIKRHYNINSAIYPNGCINPYSFLSPNFDYTFGGGMSGNNGDGWDGQVGPGIINVSWLGHGPGYTNQVGGQNHIYSDGIVTALAENIMINDKELIGPKLTFDGSVQQGSLLHTAGVAGPWVSEEGINEFFSGHADRAQVHKVKSYTSGKIPEAKFVDKLQAEKTADVGHPAPLGNHSQFTLQRYNNNGWQSQHLSEAPELYLQPGNIYRIDVRFRVGEGTIDLGPNWARLLYSDDPLGDSGFDIAFGTGQMGGYSRKSLEFLPFVRNGGEVSGFELTSWKTNPCSSYLFYGDYSEYDPIYFEDYNVVTTAGQPNIDGTYDEDASIENPYGIINVVDANQFSQVGRPDLVLKVMDIILKNSPAPPPKNPVYFEDFDMAGLTGQDPELPTRLLLNETGHRGNGVLDTVDINFWTNLGRQDVADQIAGFILNQMFPPKRADMDAGSYPGSGNFGGGIFNLSETMDGDYTTQLIQNGDLDTPNYVFQTLPNLPIQPWGLRYFEDFKAFSQMSMDFNGAFEGGNALLNFSATTYLTANMNDPHTKPIYQIFSMDGRFGYKGLSDEWYGNLNTIELGEAYDITPMDGDTLIFRNPFLANSSEYGPHTVVLTPGVYTTITFSATDNDDDITFNSDDIGAWEQIQNETGEYTGHVQDWIKRYISIREGGYETNITTFNSVYLPRTGTGLAMNGPLKPNYEPPPLMNNYPLIPNGMAFLQDFGNTSIPFENRISEFISLGYPEYADWYTEFSVDPNFFSHIPPDSPLDDGLPVYGPKAINQNLMTHLNFQTNPQMAAALVGNYIKPGPDAEWKVIEGQELILPYSSGSYNIEYNMDVTQNNNSIELVPLDSSFVLFGSTGEYPNFTINPAEVAVYYEGNETSPNDPLHIVAGWYAPRNSPIFDNGLQQDKAYYIQHQLPHSIYFVNEQLDIAKIIQEKPMGTPDVYATHNAGFANPLNDKPYIELIPRIATEIYFKPLPGPAWYHPDNGSGFINEWLYNEGFPIIREQVNHNVPYLRDTQISVSDVINHIAFPKGRVWAFVEERQIDDQGNYENVPHRTLVSTAQDSATYIANNVQASDWMGDLTEFLPGRKYKIIVSSQFTEGTIWPFFGNLGNTDFNGTMDNNYFPAMPLNVDEWRDFDIDGDGIVSLDDWQIWQNPPSGPVRQDIADYIQEFLTSREWLIWFTEIPIESDPAFEQVNITDINIPLISSDGQRKVSIQEVPIKTPYFGGKFATGTHLKGNEIYTASMEDRRKDYYIKVLNNHTTSSKAEHIFDVSFGHIKGSGSYIGVGGIGSSEAIYKQHLSNLVDVDTIERYNTAGTNLDLIRGFDITSGSSTPQILGRQSRGIDDYVYILSFNRNKFGDTLDVGDWEITLSGSLTDGKGHTLKLTDDSKDNRPTPTIAGPRYNIVSGTKGQIVSESKYGNLGWFYPHQGTMILSEKCGAILPGDRTTAATTASIIPFSHFNTTGDGGGNMARKTGSGFFIGQHTQSGSLDHRNSLRLVNMLRNVDGNCMDGIKGVENQTTVTYMCNVKAHQLNFSNNPSYTSYEQTISDRSGSYDFQPFFKMKWSHYWDGDPRAYINQVNLHDELGNVIATAKLSKPLEKDFAKEAMIKVKLTY